MKKPIITPAAKDSTIIDTVERINSNLRPFEDWVSWDLLANIKSLVANGEAVLELGSFNLESVTWDGTLFVHFHKRPTARDVVNRIIFHARADEMHMVNDRLLRLWWD
jgi:hypothetical protein